MDRLKKKVAECTEDSGTAQKCLQDLGQVAPLGPLNPLEVGDAIAGAEQLMLKAIANGIASFNRALVRFMVVEWLYVDSIRLSRSGVVQVRRDEHASHKAKPSPKDCQQISGALGPGATLADVAPCEPDRKPGQDQQPGAAVHTINTVGVQSILLGVGLIIAALLLIFQAMRTMLSRKGAPLMEAVRGLIVMGVMAVFGVVLVDTLLLASDVLTRAILDSALGEGLRGRVDVMLTGFMVMAPVAVILLGCVLFLISLVQLIVLFFRQAAIPILALLIPVTAAGQVGGGSSRQWLTRLWTSIIAIVLYKPLAALIFAVGFLEMGNGSSLWDFVRGIVTVVLAIIALPTLMKMFTPIVGQAVGGDSGFVSGFFTMLSAASHAQDLVGGGKGGGGGDEGSDVDAADPTTYADYGDEQDDATDQGGGVADTGAGESDESGAPQQEGQDEALAGASPEAAVAKEAADQVDEHVDAAKEQVGQAADAMGGNDGLNDPPPPPPDDGP